MTGGAAPLQSHVASLSHWGAHHWTVHPACATIGWCLGLKKPLLGGWPFDPRVTLSQRNTSKAPRREQQSKLRLPSVPISGTIGVGEWYCLRGGEGVRCWPNDFFLLLALLTAFGVSLAAQETSRCGYFRWSESDWSGANLGRLRRSRGYVARHSDFLWKSVGELDRRERKIRISRPSRGSLPRRDFPTWFCPGNARNRFVSGLPTSTRI